MKTYQDPNSNVDAPVKRQIILVLLGFASMVAIVAVIINQIFYG